MEEWQQAQVETAIHTKEMKESLKNVATKDDLEAQTQIICTEIKANAPSDDFKEKLIMWLVIGLFAALGLTSTIKYLVNGG